MYPSFDVATQSLSPYSPSSTVFITQVPARRRLQFQPRERACMHQENSQRFTDHQKGQECLVSHHRSHKQKSALPLRSSKHETLNKVIFPRASVHPMGLRIQSPALRITMYNAYNGYIYWSLHTSYRGTPCTCINPFNSPTKQSRYCHLSFHKQGNWSPEG